MVPLSQGQEGAVHVTEDVAWYTVEHASDVGRVRRAASELVRRVGMSAAREGEAAIVVTELATNQLKHAGGGTVLLRIRRGLERAAVEVLALDDGPGIRDLGTAVTDGHSTAGTLGIGLGSVRRLATTCDLWSAPGKGTVIAATIAEGAAARELPVAGLTRPIPGEEVCGDAYAHRWDGDRLSVLMVDGLGHGPLAAAAAAEAVRAFRAAAEGDVVELLGAVHAGLRGTRGAAAAVAQVVVGGVVFAGVGNIGAVITDGVDRKGLASQPGIAGGVVRRIRSQEYELGPHSVLVLHSDGVTDRLSLDGRPGLLARSPLVVAGVVLRDFGGRRDDAGVVVASPGWPR